MRASIIIYGSLGDHCVHDRSFCDPPIGNQSVLKGNFLDFPGHVSQIDQQAIHLCHPEQRVLLDQARKRPLRIDQPHSNRFFDSACLGVDGALVADIECGAQVRRCHVRRERFVVEKIYPPGCRLCRKRRWGIPGDDHGHATADQFTRKRGQTVVLTLSPAPFDGYVFSLDEAGILQSLDESGQQSGGRTRGPAGQESDYFSRLLRACRTPTLPRRA